MTADIDNTFSVMVGQRIAGGCDDCNAFQTVEPDDHGAGIWHLRVHHDDSCPFLRRHRERELESLRKAWHRTGNPARRTELAARAAQIKREMQR